MSAPTLLLIGSGPGIGLSTSILFAQKKFAKVALVSRNATRLAAEANTVASSATQDEKEIDVKTWAVDITDSPAFTHVLSEVGAWGDVTCVIFNAARVQPSALLEESDEEILEDFKVTTIALHTTASWAMPLLSKREEAEKPSLLVTSSLLWKQPVPMFFSLSLAKSSQRNLVQSLGLSFPSVHCATLNVGGEVKPEDKFLNPTRIAEKYWELYDQEKAAWTEDLDVLGEQ